jgi:cell division protein FtsB
VTASRGRRATGRPIVRAASRPVQAGLRVGRPGQRPSGRRSTRAASAVAARRPLFTGRAVLLVGLVLLLALTLAGPLRQYVAGRQELAQLAAEHEALTQRAAELQSQLDRQSDPAYISQEARERLTMVLPGDRLIIVGDAGDPGDTADAPAGSADEHAPVPWYEGLLGSIAAADG